MRCPRGDGELIERFVTGVGGISLTYHLCLGCLGHWTAAFDANYFPLDSLDDARGVDRRVASFRCPVCQEPLERSHSDAMAPDILAFYCSAGHGYFFPRGNLRKFRTAQEARITYHKLWQIPTPGVTSVLLTGVIVFMLVTSGVLVSQIRQRQQTATQAQSLIVSRQVIISDGRVVIFTRTTRPVKIYLVIDSLGIDTLMQSPDGIIHEIILDDVSPGTYLYTMTALVGEGKITSPIYDFYVPDGRSSR